MKILKPILLFISILLILSIQGVEIKRIEPQKKDNKIDSLTTVNKVKDSIIYDLYMENKKLKNKMYY
jgi:hypothetical protein